MPEPTAADVARLIDVSPATLRRWVRSGAVPLKQGSWTPAAIAQARIVTRLRERGQSMQQIRAAVREGRLAYGYLEQLFPAGDHYGHAVNRASRIAAPAAGGEVLVTRPVVESAGAHLSFDQIGAVTMEGFSDPTELLVAGQAEERRRAGG